MVFGSAIGFLETLQERCEAVKRTLSFTRFLGNLAAAWREVTSRPCAFQESFWRPSVSAMFASRSIPRM
jgi:hypothetical protein